MKKSVLISTAIFVTTILGFANVSYAQLYHFTSEQLAPSASSGDCLTTDGTFNIWSTCSSGGGGGAGTFSTTTSGGHILQYPYTTLVTSLDGNATSTSDFWFDPFITKFFTTNASTTAFTTVNAYIGSLSGILKGTSGHVVTASDGTDYWSPTSLTNNNQLTNGAGYLTSYSVSTSTSETAGQLAMWSTTAGTPARLYSIPTTTASCSGSASCSSFTVIGASPVTITGTDTAFSTTSADYYVNASSTIAHPAGLGSSSSTGGVIQWNGSRWVAVATSTLGLGGTGGSGTVTSVDMSVPVGFSVTGAPITSSGTLGISYFSGYSLPLTASTTEGSKAYASTTALNATSPITYAPTTGTIACPTCAVSSALFGKTWEVYGNNSWLAPTTTKGIIVSASSTAGNGTATGGLNVFGDATTTGTFHTDTIAGITSPSISVDLFKGQLDDSSNLPSVDFQAGRR